MAKLRMLLVAPCVFALVLPASAQNRIGIAGGVNLANVSVDPEPSGVDFGTRTGLGFGGVFDLTLSDNVALHFEPLYLQKGSKLESGAEEAKLKYVYVEVPALFKLALGTSTTRPYVMAGPTIGFLLSAKASNGIEVDIKDETKSIDFGLGLGAGVSFPAGNNFVFVEGRYALGLSNINDDPDAEEIDLKNKGIQVIAGITFPLGAQ